jgi:hypothetical protein
MPKNVMSLPRKETLEIAISGVGAQAAGVLMLKVHPSFARVCVCVLIQIMSPCVSVLYI